MNTLLALCLPWTWRMAWRDARSARARLLLFSTSISFGIAALVAIGALNRTLKGAIGEQSKALVGAGLVLTSRARFGEAEQPLLQRLGGERAEEVSFTSMLGFPTAPDGGGTRLVNVRALTGAFPFYGRLETEPPEAADTFRTGEGLLVEESVARQFGAAVGTPVKLGTWETRIVGLLRKVPGDSMGFNTLAPRVYLAGSALAQTGLLRGPSLARHRLMFRLPTDGPARVAAEHEEFRRLNLEWDTVEKRERSLGRSLEQLNSFLNLVAFIALLLGAVGIASAIQVHVRQRLPQVAVLRCLGADRARAAAIYLAQALGMGFFGALFGVILGTCIPLALPQLLGQFLPFPVVVTIAPLATLRAAGLGMLISFVFALLPLLAVRRVPPLAAIRAAAAEPVSSRDPARWAVLAVIGGMVLLAAMAQTRHWYEGLGFAGGLGAAFLALTLTARAVIALTRRFTPPGLPFAWRQGLASLHRPQNRTTTLLVALGLGTFLLLTLQFVRSTLLSRLFPLGPTRQPNVMLFDVQPDQREAVLALLATNGLPVLDEAPIVTMRLKSVNGVSIRDLQKRRSGIGEAPGVTNVGAASGGRERRRGGGREEGEERRPPGWVLTREYRSTWRTNLNASERLTAGVFVGQVAEGTTPVPVSVEEGIAKDLGLHLDSALEFDVQGVTVACRVASLRAVEWRQVRPNFFVVFPAGALEAAPAMHILATRTEDAASTARLQRELFRTLPNVSSIDIGLVLETLDIILSRIGWVIRLMTLFTVATGLVVLMGAIVSGRWQRARESVLLRTLGASRSVVRRILLAEYFILGLLSAVVGLVLAAGAGWAISHWVFEVGFSLPWRDVAIAFVAVPGLTVTLGLLSSRGLADTPPLEILRGEV